MKVLNFGSLNLDYVYAVDHIVEPGETLASRAREVCSGGKGLNQSVALARAGVQVYHAGSIGADGAALLETLQAAQVNTDFIYRQDAPGGHTVIQVDANGQNCIIVYGGTNKMISKAHIDSVLSNFGRGDFLLLQNEINEVPYIIDTAYGRGMKIIWNPSPFEETVLAFPLHKINVFVLNEIEGKLLTGVKSVDEVIPALHEKYPDANILLTLGGEGSTYFCGGTIHTQGIFPVVAVDTTAAGDTFLGYFVYGLVNRFPVAKMLEMAAKAASITVTRKGAAASIPALREVVQK